ncbi:hypothetical protein BVC80_8483g7 [Macleaya cordata]|uniref:Uncharacterized protein n=1 Tax=Macleaya cordata TaxID=56857 RepID=A0A200R191_MACCD|nr:hypothetical protein BVC80_8483g7 [Macleaya cordata]
MEAITISQLDFSNLQVGFSFDRGKSERLRESQISDLLLSHDGQWRSRVDVDEDDDEDASVMQMLPESGLIVVKLL